MKLRYCAILMLSLGSGCKSPENKDTAVLEKEQKEQMVLKESFVVLKFGTVELEDKDGKKSQVEAESESSPAKVIRLTGGETVRTQKDSECQLVIPETGVIELYSESGIKIPAIAPEEAQKEKMSTSVEFLGGKLFLDIDAEKLSKEKKEFRVKTPTTILAVKGTRFYVETGKDFETTGVHEGRVLMYETQSEKHVIINSKQVATAKPGAITQPRAMTEEELTLTASYNSLASEFVPAEEQKFAEGSFVYYPGKDGPGKGKHVVLIAGDEQYRSEEALPMLGKILSQHYGFDCTVLFSVSKEGLIDPYNRESLSNPEAIDTADAILMFTRLRRWPAETMKRFDAAMDRGVPVVALRTSTHAFLLPEESPYAAEYNAFGKEVLGEKWVAKWGEEMKEATRGVIEKANMDHPVLNGVTDVFGHTEVYEAAPSADATILMRGQVLEGMKPDDGPASYNKTTQGGIEQNVNDPMMPVAWTRELKKESGEQQKIVCTTMGSSTDLASEGLRRLVVNGVFWSLGMDVPEKANVDIVGDYEAIMHGGAGFRKKVKPSDHALDKK